MQFTDKNIRLVRDAEGNPYGISLGVCDDYADHHVGHERLSKCLGVGRASDDGIDQHRMTIGRKLLGQRMWVMNLKSRPGEWKKLPAETRLLVAAPGSWELDEYRADDLSKSFHLEDFRTGAIPPLKTAWSSHGFMIRAFGTEERAFTKRLAKALENDDVVLGNSQTLKFGDGPLVVAIASAVPEAILAAHRDAQPDAENEEHVEQAPSLGF